MHFFDIKFEFVVFGMEVRGGQSECIKYFMSFLSTETLMKLVNVEN